jgi:alanyl-tRNA synthetase
MRPTLKEEPEKGCRAINQNRELLKRFLCFFPHHFDERFQSGQVLSSARPCLHFVAAMALHFREHLTGLEPLVLHSSEKQRKI